MKWIEDNVYKKKNGDFSTNYTHNDLKEQQAYAWSNYLQTGSKEALAVAEMWDQAENKFLHYNKLDKGSFATKLPEWKNHIKEGLKFAVPAAAAGSQIPGVGTAAAGFAGYSAGVAKDNFTKNSGMAYRNLLHLGMEPEKAREIALASNAAKEIAGFGIDALTGKLTKKISDDVLQNVTKYIVKEVGESAVNEFIDFVTKKHVDNQIQ